MAEIDPLNLDFAHRHPEAFARVLGRADVADSARIIDSLPADLRAAVVARLPASQVERLVHGDDSRPAEWLAHADFEDAIGLLSRLPRERRLALVNTLADPDRKRRLLRHQQYPRHSVGALVGDLPMRIGSQANAADVLGELRDFDADDPGPLVVVDRDGRYVGALDRWRLLIANPPAGLVQDYVTEVRALRPETPIEVAIAMPDWHARNWLPVVDHEQRVLGSVTREKIFAAAGGHGAQDRPGGVFGDLFTDLTYLFGAALEALIPGRKSR